MIDRPGKLAAIALILGTALAAPPPTAAGPGAAGRGPRSPRSAADYVVLVWYRRDDPLGTFRYRYYDARKGEYTPAVDDWLRLLREKYPRYEARALPVDLSREEGRTEKLKVGSVIHRELILAAAEAGIVPGAPMTLAPGPHADAQRPARSLPRPETPGAGGSTPINPVGAPTPFPMPYTRPHP